MSGDIIILHMCTKNHDHSSTANFKDEFDERKQQTYIH